MYGHIAKIAEAEKAGIEAAGGKADVFQYVPIPTYWDQKALDHSPGPLPKAP